VFTFSDYPHPSPRKKNQNRNSRIRKINYTEGSFFSVKKSLYSICPNTENFDIDISFLKGRQGVELFVHSQTVSGSKNLLEAKHNELLSVKGGTYIGALFT
jgi:hypothetical protein